MSWQGDARCAGMDVNIFYPTSGQSSERAKRICEACPVRVQCLNHALRTNERHGVWGGMSPRERR